MPVPFCIIKHHSLFEYDGALMLKIGDPDDDFGNAIFVAIITTIGYQILDKKVVRPFLPMTPVIPVLSMS